jgi:hypothetical protein
MSILNSANSGKNSFEVTKEFLERRGYEVYDCFAIYKSPYILVNSSNKEYEYECSFVIDTEGYSRCYTIPVESVYVLELIEDIWSTEDTEECIKKQQQLINTVYNVSVTRSKKPIVTERVINP